MGRFSKPVLGIKTTTVDKLPKSVSGKAIRVRTTDKFTVYNYGNRTYYVRRKKRKR